MARCEFRYTLPGSAGTLLAAMRRDFARFGGTVVGAEAAGGQGTFTLPTPIGEFDGVFQVTERDGACDVRIEVDGKPLFVTCSMIGEHLERRLRKAVAAA